MRCCASGMRSSRGWCRASRTISPRRSGSDGSRSLAVAVPAFEEGQRVDRAALLPAVRPDLQMEHAADGPRVAGLADAAGELPRAHALAVAERGGGDQVGVTVIGGGAAAVDDE